MVSHSLGWMSYGPNSIPHSEDTINSGKVTLWEAAKVGDGDDKIMMFSVIGLGFW